jgi:hypothetical protein
MKYTSRTNTFVLGLFLVAASLSSAQEKIRTVEKGRQYQNSPIEIIGQQVGDKTFIDDTSVSADKYWLRDLVLTIKNVSNKNILSFDIDLLVKKNGKVLMGIPVNFRTYTTITQFSAKTTDGKKKIGILKPGEVICVKVTDKAILLFSNKLLKTGIEDLERVTVDLRFVYFDDNTRWFMGHEGPYNKSRSSLSDKRRFKT